MFNKFLRGLVRSLIKIWKKKLSVTSEGFVVGSFKLCLCLFEVKNFKLNSLK